MDCFLFCFSMGAAFVFHREIKSDFSNREQDLFRETLTKECVNLELEFSLKALCWTNLPYILHFSTYFPLYISNIKQCFQKYYPFSQRFPVCNVFRKENIISFWLYHEININKWPFLISIININQHDKMAFLHKSKYALCTSLGYLQEIVIKQFVKEDIQNQ